VLGCLGSVSTLLPDTLLFLNMYDRKEAVHPTMYVTLKLIRREYIATFTSMHKYRQVVIKAGEHF